MASQKAADTDPAEALAENEVAGERSPSSEAIQAAAFELFARRGYLAASVREVMQACGLTQGALYNHFPSKDQLLATLIRTTQDGLEAECAAAVAAAAGDTRAELCAFVEAFTVRHCKRRTEALVANRDFEWLKPASLQEIVASRRRIRDMLVDILQRGVAAEVFRLPAIAGRSDARLVAMAILNQSIHVSSWFKPGGLWNEREVAALHAEMALRIAGG